MEKKRDYNRVTKEEMNLVEYPFQYLGRIVPDEVKTIEWSDEIIDKNGERVIAKWIVTGSDKYGLPRLRDRDVLLGLMYFWKLQGFQSQTLVIENASDFLELLNLGTGGSYYEILQEALDRIAGVTVIAEYSFWDNASRNYVDHTVFHILEMAKIERIGNRNKIIVKASDVFWRSLQNGYIKSLNLDFYLSLKTPTAKALYCYLDKKAYGKDHFEIEINKLASHIGIMAKIQKNIKKAIKEASDILIQRGYLSCYLFKKQNGKELIAFDFRKEYLEPEFQEQLAQNEAYIQHLIEEIYSVVGKDSPEFVEKTARNVPPDLIFRILGEIKEMAVNGELRTSRFEAFKKLVKKYMKEIFNLSFK